MKRLAPITLLLVLFQNAVAQRMGSAPHFAPHFGGPHSAARSFAYPVPFFSDGLYSDALYPSGYGSAGYPSAQPAVIVLQAPPVADPAPAPLPAPAQPLLIELQGGRYVRVSGDDSSGAEMIDSAPMSKPSELAARPEVREARSAILVFRDGHRETVSEYTIAGGVLYAGGNYYTDGSWNRKIELSSLNLPETVASNRASGLTFQLPGAPNEVIVGP